MNFIFAPPPWPALPIQQSAASFPVHRIYCVGKNYAAHIREMGSDPAREPYFFMKPADALVTDGRMPYPPGTSNLHYEGELVIAIGTGGADISPDTALEHVFGYAAGLDMTRRDLQAAAGRLGQPWDTGKAFDHSAPVAPLVPVAVCGHPQRGAIRLWVNGELRQDADLGDMIWKCNEIISELSRLYTLQAGDLIFTGTPAGVGAVLPGDSIELGIAGLGVLEVAIVGAQRGA
jgi:fumarylpyruvate hydrolase